jgi:DNA repair protein RecN (Recombination protein N)
MLKQLSIQNLALINNLNLEFSAGLTIITGETGAGKSILIQAVEALLGQSMGSESVRTGSSVARVEGWFTLNSTLFDQDQFKQLELVIQNEKEICLIREIHRKGRDRFLVNEQVVRKTEFQWLGHQLLDVNSQHSHQYLLKTKNHLELFDGALKCKDLPERLKHTRQMWEKSASDWHELKQSIDSREKRRQLIEYQMREIDDANLRSGEKDELTDERERLRFAEDIKANLDEAYGLLEQEPGMVSDNLARVTSFLERAAGRDSRLEELAERAKSLSLSARDITDEIMQAMQAVTVSPERLNAVSDRLYLLQQLEGKFQYGIDGIMEYRRNIEKEYYDYSFERASLEKIEKTCANARDEYMKLNHELSEYRNRNAPALCNSIEKSLSELGMRYARFDIKIDRDWLMDESHLATNIPDRCSPSGTDRMEFMMSANPGVPLKPLSQIASGGELSRVMLAIKQFLVKNEHRRTMVFDEVDSGIGGDIANVVGDKLRLLAKDHQILCVTHLPQIAIRGHQHILVDKQSNGDTTTVQLMKLDMLERVHEIARMLGGNRSDSSALAHAESMLASITD